MAGCASTPPRSLRLLVEEEEGVARDDAAIRGTVLVFKRLSSVEEIF